MKRPINPGELCKPSGFQHGWLVESGGGARTLYLAGQCDYDQAGAVRRRGDLAGQVRGAMENIGFVLRDAGMAFDDVVQLNLYVRSRDDYVTARREIGAAWKQICGRHYPAMALFMVMSLLDPDALVEIQGIAAQ
ncbi:MAG: RidA family protein [Planctomycetes bacterium]|nr:RidA family protein [Planctomycetota bacterium]